MGTWYPSACIFRVTSLPPTFRWKHVFLDFRSYYSPACWILNDMLIGEELWTISYTTQTKLLSEIMGYSLSSLVLNKVCWARKLYRNYFDMMVDVHDKIDTIWSRQSSRGWGLIRKNLVEIWKIRSLVVSKYMHRFPQSSFKEIFMPLIVSNDTSAFEQSSDGDDTCSVSLSETNRPRSTFRGSCCRTKCLLSR